MVTWNEVSREGKALVGRVPGGKNEVSKDCGVEVRFIPTLRELLNKCAKDCKFTVLRIIRRTERAGRFCNSSDELFLRCLYKPNTKCSLILWVDDWKTMGPTVSLGLLYKSLGIDWERAGPRGLQQGPLRGFSQTWVLKSTNAHRLPLASRSVFFVWWACSISCLETLITLDFVARVRS